MNGKRNLSRIMSVLLAASSVIGGASTAGKKRRHDEAVSPLCVGVPVALLSGAAGYGLRCLLEDGDKGVKVTEDGERQLFKLDNDCSKFYDIATSGGIVGVGKVLCELGIGDLYYGEVVDGGGYLVTGVKEEGFKAPVFFGTGVYGINKAIDLEEGPDCEHYVHGLKGDIGVLVLPGKFAVKFVKGDYLRAVADICLRHYC